MAHIKLTKKDIFGAPDNNVIWFHHAGINYRYNRSGYLQRWLIETGEYLTTLSISKILLDNKKIEYIFVSHTNDIVARTPTISNGKVEFKEVTQ